MSNELDPVVGKWYHNPEKEQLFRVVAIDDDEEIIKIQTVDGEHEEIDAAVWFELDLDPAEEPEDWTPPLGEDEPEDSDEDWVEGSDDEDDDDWDDDEDDDSDDDYGSE